MHTVYIHTIKIFPHDSYKSALFPVIKLRIEPRNKLLLEHLDFFLAGIHCSQTVALLHALTPRTSLAFQLHKCVRIREWKGGVRLQEVMYDWWRQCLREGMKAKSGNLMKIHSVYHRGLLNSTHDHLLYRCISFKFPLSLIIPSPRPLQSSPVLNTFHSPPLCVCVS